MSAVAIITARGGSKRIPRKNIKSFCGMPIIGYSIKAALKSKAFAEVMVSTDDQEIAEIARRFGAVVPFIRNQQTSNDFATTSDVLIEVLASYAAMDKRFDQFCCLYPTAPMVTSDFLQEAMALLQSTGAPSVIPVVRYSFPPQRACHIVNGALEMLYPENLPVRSQDMEPLYHDCGMFYCANTASFLRENQLMMKGSLPYILPETVVQDIDNPEDWEMAEIKYRLLTEGMQK